MSDLMLQKSGRVIRGAGAVAALALAFSWAGCSCGDDATVGPTYTCNTPNCISLEAGLIGSYTSAAAKGSTIWVSGYSEADWNNAYSYGDLAVGKWNASKGQVDWSLIDGVPTDPPPDTVHYNKNGFRGGQTDAGDDVGIWTSLALDGKGNPAVAYHDRTNRALKFAQFDGKAWRTTTVQRKDQADLGRYAKLLFINGNPAIVYLAMEAGGDGGAIVSGVRLAAATKPAPGEGDWLFEEVSQDKLTPCRAYFCATGTKCVKDTQVCTATLPGSSCTTKCSSGTSCVDVAGTPTCVDVIDNNFLDAYPAAVGLYVSAALDPKGNLGIAYYDRLRGNLVAASKDANSGAWKNTIVDGEANGADTGDKGIGASLFIDASGDWHLAYVDGHSEGLQYVRLAQGTTPSAPELVDDGLSIEGDKFADGQHIVGDDSNIWVSDQGEVHISYQDATVGTLRHAVGTTSGTQHTWNVSMVAQEGRFGGAFSRVLLVDGKLQLLNWWRTGGLGGVYGDVAIITP